MSERRRSHEAALRYAEALISDMHPDDLRDIEVMVEPDGYGSVAISIKAEVLESRSTENLFETTFQFMRRRERV